MMIDTSHETTELMLKIPPISFSASYLTKNQNGIYLEGGNFLYTPVIYCNYKLNDLPSPPRVNEDFLLMNFEEPLKQVKEKWDHYTYLPLRARFISIQTDEMYYKCRWKWNKKKMELKLPKNECLPLPTSQITLTKICHLITSDYFTAMKLLHPNLLSLVRQVKGILQGVHGTVSVVIQESPTVITAT